MLDRENLMKLAAIALKSDNGAVAYSFNDEQFTSKDASNALRAELAELTKTYADYRANKNLVFELIEKAIDETLPAKVTAQFEQFAETMVLPQGTKYVFKQKITEASKRRAKKFITRVGLAGVYEVFKLEGTSMEVETSAIGGACYIPIEEFLDRKIDWADVYNIVVDGMDEYIYLEIEKALASLATSALIPANNKASGSSFVEAEMDKLLAIADSYGVNNTSTIFCTYEFAAQMLPATTSGTAWGNGLSESMKNELWTKGYLRNYKGHNIVILPQSMADETNTTKVIDPSMAYIIPAGAEKPVKVVIEGATAVRDIDREDWSKELQTYKKVGVGLITVNHGICVYKNTSLSKTV